MPGGVRYKSRHVRNSFREPAYRRSRIAETHTAGSVTIQQCIQFFRILNSFGLARDILILLGFLNEGVEFIKAIRIQQAQARKVTGQTQLFGSGSEKEQTRCLSRERLDQRVL